MVPSAFKSREEALRERALREVTSADAGSVCGAKGQEQTEADLILLQRWIGLVVGTVTALHKKTASVLEVDMNFSSTVDVTADSSKERKAKSADMFDSDEAVRLYLKDLYITEGTSSIPGSWCILEKVKTKKRQARKRQEQLIPGSTQQAPSPHQLWLIPPLNHQLLSLQT